MRFDKAAEFLAQHFGFSEQHAQFHDRGWIGEQFQAEVRTLGRDLQSNAVAYIQYETLH